MKRETESIYTTKSRPVGRKSCAPEEERKKQREAQRAELARDNFGFRKIDRVPGNVGYLEFRYLAPPELAGET